MPGKSSREPCSSRLSGIIVNDDRTNVIDVHIGRLRHKIDGEGDSPMLQTIRGAGYVLRSPE